MVIPIRIRVYRANEKHCEIYNQRLIKSLLRLDYQPWILLAV